MVGLIATHVDDLKCGGLKWVLDELIQRPEKTFGPLAKQEKEFVNTGIAHKQTDEGDIYMNQDKYIDGLRPIRSASLSRHSPETECNEELRALLRSQLGALAYALLTQCWAAAFVTALQRVAAKPLQKHCFALNKVLKAMQTHKRSVVFNKMNVSEKTFDGFSDAAFKGEDASGCSLRGALYLRRCRQLGKPVVHLLLVVCKLLALVTRSTHAAELLGCETTIDHGFIVLTMLQ